MGTPMNNTREYAVCGDCGSQHPPTTTHHCTSRRAVVLNTIRIVDASIDEVTEARGLAWLMRIKRRCDNECRGSRRFDAVADLSTRICALLEGSDV